MFQYGPDPRYDAGGSLKSREEIIRCIWPVCARKHERGHKALANVRGSRVSDNPCVDCRIFDLNLTTGNTDKSHASVATFHCTSHIAYFPSCRLQPDDAVAPQENMMVAFRG